MSIQPIIPMPAERMQFGPNRPDKPWLSILVPFYRDDPCALLGALSEQAMAGVEVILYDDGTQDRELSFRINAVAGQSRLPVTLLTVWENQGRSTARNSLVNAANGEYLLFLDADMMPPENQFLQTYHQAISVGHPAVVFGGFATPAHVDDPTHRLHCAVSAGSDCLPAAERSKVPAKHVCTSNLLVRNDVLLANPFDTEFTGWGWEDVEWAARVARRHEIRHVDNAALHLGLESDRVLLDRYKTSASNYARFVQRHPDMAEKLPSFKAARMAQRLPFLRWARPLLARMTLAQKLPMKLRILALKIWRASWYGEELS